ncbi:S10 family peptidase [Mobilicoccus caccae]|uniref:Peptidase S10 n=1 Tax=Mobilicoccus caccae TaxID=1859295 RepID=A0ABQ6IVT4_9MICO|nr:peptidase S10 [Mobilicoccus caccae]GMA42053.1 peptidase S10 [Mobilicoccus caccae]
MGTDDTAAKTPEPNTEKPDPVDALVSTRHTLDVDGGTLAYSARTGRIVIREEETKDDVFHGWKARAELSVTAYTLDDADPATRPITFVFNGGPGSSSVWLHLGLLGPRIVDAGEPGSPTPPPYRLIDNPHTLLAHSDLVFIDPLSTGQSRVVEGGKAKEFLGWKKDVEQVSELIRLWCTREDRWMSPKFVCGESYGTTRAVSVAAHLFDTYGMQLNGLVLISSVLDFGSQDFDYLRHDEACLSFLPTYAAIAHYHGLIPDRSLEEVLAEAEELSAGPYRSALARGHRLTDEERTEMAGRLAALTGLSVDYLLRCDLRPEHWRYCTEVLRDRGLTVGRIDGRITGPLHSRIAEKMDADPSIDALQGPYAAAIHHYLRAELNSDLDLPFMVFSDAFSQWSYKEFEGKPIDVTDKLERVIAPTRTCRCASSTATTTWPPPTAQPSTRSRTSSSPPRRSTASSTPTSRPVTCRTSGSPRASRNCAGSRRSCDARAPGMPHPTRQTTANITDVVALSLQTPALRSSGRR